MTDSEAVRRACDLFDQRLALSEVGLAGTAAHCSLGDRELVWRLVVVRVLDHQVHIEKNIIGCVNGFHHGRSEGDIIHKMPVHDVEVQPVGSSGDRLRTFFRDPGKICSQHGGSDNAVGVAPFLHVLCLTGQRSFSRFPRQERFCFLVFCGEGVEICAGDNFGVWLLPSLCLLLVSE